MHLVKMIEIPMVFELSYGYIFALLKHMVHSQMRYSNSILLTVHRYCAFIELLKMFGVSSFRYFITDIRSLRFNSEVVFIQVC